MSYAISDPRDLEMIQDLREENDRLERQLSEVTQQRDDMRERLQNEADLSTSRLEWGERAEAERDAALSELAALRGKIAAIINGPSTDPWGMLNEIAKSVLSLKESK